MGRQGTVGDFADLVISGFQRLGRFVHGRDYWEQGDRVKFEHEDTGEAEGVIMDFDAEEIEAECALCEFDGECPECHIPMEHFAIVCVEAWEELRGVITVIHLKRGVRVPVSALESA